MKHVLNAIVVATLLIICVTLADAIIGKGRHDLNTADNSACSAICLFTAHRERISSIYLSLPD